MAMSKVRTDDALPAAVAGTAARGVAGPSESSRPSWLLSIFLAFAVGCEAPGPAERTAARPDILVVTIDTLRADHVSAYGYSRPTSPGLDRIAQEGALFETVYAPMGATSPAHATLFTSRSPLAHGLVRNGFHLVPEEQTLAELLGGAGYRTAAFVSSYPLKRRFGFGQGFNHFDEGFAATGSTMNLPFGWEGWKVEGGFDRRAEATVDAALAWRGRQGRAQPLMVWVHLFDPHEPYAAPPPWKDRFVRKGQSVREKLIARYDGEILYADEQLARLATGFEAEAGDRSLLLVVTADHGEGLYDHDHSTHNRTLYEEELRVPLVFHWPKRIPAGLRIRRPSHLIDVTPTVLGLIGLTPPAAAFDGIDLAPARAGEAADAGERPLWLQRPYYEEGRKDFGERGYGFGVRLGSWKLIEAPAEGRRELYDLAADPGERRDLSERRPELAEQLAGQIRAFREAESGKPRASAARDPSESDREALRALGYAE
jgi:arylsulfatase A-like enzyme